MNTETLEKPANGSVGKGTQSIGNFGEGRYSPLMAETFKAAQTIFRLSEKAADKLARQIGSDYGASMRNVQVDAKIKRGMSKDGKITLSETAKLKGVTETLALTAMETLKWVSEAGKHKIVYANTKWEVQQGENSLGEYLASLEA